MLRGHIACQQDRQATRLLCNKCRGSAAQRAYIRLRPPAYVTGDSPRGSIGPPPERGVEVYMVWSGHVLAPDPRLALMKAWLFFVPRSRDPAEGGPDLTQRGPGPVPGVRSVSVEVLDLPDGPVRVCRGPTLSHGGLDPPLISWRILSSLVTWRSRNRPRDGVGHSLPRD
jgi:hypothetical protein